VEDGEAGAVDDFGELLEEVGEVVELEDGALILLDEVGEEEEGEVGDVEDDGALLVEEEGEELI
jgi:hypothetical protein